MFLTHAVRHSAPVLARFHCPACGERDVEGAAWTEHQLTRLLWLVQVMDERLHWVQGPCCRRRLMSRVAPAALAELQADDVEAQALLRDRVSPVKVTLLIGAILLAIVPVFGPVFLLAAWWPNGSSRTWFRLTCRAVLLVHVVAMNAIAVVAMSAKEK